MTTSLEERIARIERFLGIHQAEGSAAEREQANGEERLHIGAWLESHRLPGEILSAMAIMLEKGSMASVFAWKDEPVRIDADDIHKTAALCEALASEVRLNIIQELFDGPKTTAELLQAVNLDRSQLYHHLRDLFVHGLVAQPERGRYNATNDGRSMLLAVSHLAKVGHASFRATAELDMGD